MKTKSEFWRSVACTIGLVIANSALWVRLAGSHNYWQAGFWGFSEAVCLCLSLPFILPVGATVAMRVTGLWMFFAFPSALETRRLILLSLTMSAIGILAGHYAIVIQMINQTHWLFFLSFCYAEAVALVMSCFFAQVWYPTFTYAISVGSDFT
jgi:hypothetical protein